jgi:hypothetical protein
MRTTIAAAALAASLLLPGVCAQAQFLNRNKPSTPPGTGDPGQHERGP